MAVGSVILMVTVNVFFNLQFGFNRNVNQITAESDLQGAVTAIHKDLIQAQAFDINGGVTIMTWTDNTGNRTDHEVNYGFYGYNGTGSTVLWRVFDGIPQIVGRNIIYLNFTSDNVTSRVIISSAGSKQEQKSKTIEFSVTNRTGVIW